MSSGLANRRIWDGWDITVAFALLNLLFFGQFWLRHVAVKGWRSYRAAYLGLNQEAVQA